ncbi:MAG: ShlB/FhaC/HecB family hemolysin secretion/activation protein [Sphingomonadaceae bacterium]|nr:ShlB/FhaC/HecB family hemolysin secretion/activation protein [Sphingomonadaceae bacterium]
MKGRWNGAIGLWLASTAAWAQAPQAAPPTREQITRAPDQTPVSPTGRTRLRVEDRVERAPCPLADPHYAAIKVTLREAVFAGLKGGVTAADLQDAADPFLGKEQPIAVVCEIRDRAATILRRAGYLAAIQIPPQQIDGGRVRFDVLFAHLQAIRVRGNAGRSERLIASVLQPLTDDEVFNERDAERRLLLARDLPGFDVRLTLRPAGEAGQVVGDITVIRTPLFADANIQNLGSQQVGRWAGTVRAQVNGLTGLGDSTAVSFFNTTDLHEQHVLTGSHQFLLGSSGVGAAGSFTYAWTRPDVPGLNLDSRTLIGSFNLNFPLVRSRARTLRVSAGMDIVDQTVDLAGARLTTDRLRVPFLRFDIEASSPASVRGENGLSITTPRWRVGGTLDLRHGIDALGASPGCGPSLLRCAAPGSTIPSRPFGDPQSFVLRFAGSAEYRPSPDLAFVVGPRAQYSPKSLLSFEEFSAGNYTVGRGYDPGALIGDSGVGVSAEIRAGRQYASGPNKLYLQPYAFVDSAWVWNNDPPAANPPRNPQTLTSFGFGARGGLGDYARFEMTAAIPAEQIGTNRQVPPVRFLISVSTRLWPWPRG